MTFHSSSGRGSTVCWLSCSLFSLLQEFPCIWASQRMLIYHQQVWDLTFDSEKFQLRAEPNSRVRTETHSQQVSWIKCFLFYIFCPSTHLKFADVFLWNVFDFFCPAVFSSSCWIDVACSFTVNNCDSYCFHGILSLDFPNKTHHNGDRANCWKLSCPGPNCCQDLAPLQRKRYKCLAAPVCQLKK